MEENKNNNELQQLDDKDTGVNKPSTVQLNESFLGWHEVERADLPYEGMLYPESYVFKVQAASAGTISHYSSMDETNPLSVQAALTHVIKEHIQVFDGKRNIDPLEVIHESMRFWFAMLVHSYTGNATSLEHTETCPALGCGHNHKVTITPHVTKFTEMSDYVRTHIDASTGNIVQKTKSYGTLVYQPITIKMRGELLSYMQEQYQKKQDFDMQFLSFAPLIWPQRKKGQTVDDLYKNVYFPITKDHKKFSVYTKIIRQVALDQLLFIETNCSKCNHRFQVDISQASGLRDIFLAKDIDDELVD